MVSTEGTVDNWLQLTGQTSVGQSEMLLILFNIKAVKALLL